MNKLRYGCTLLLLLATTTAASAQTPSASSLYPGLNVDVAYVYYDVNGSTAAELLTSLRNNGPSTGNSSYFAATSSQTGFGYKMKDRGRICRLTDVGVTVKISMLLPLWAGRDLAPEPLRRTWDEFLEKLQMHEGGHVRIIEHFSRELYNGLRKISSERCGVLDSRAKAFTDDLSRRQDLANSVYDQKTRHGINEGAVWPPVPASASL